MNCPYLPILPYESQFLIDNCDMTIESDVFNKINEINEIIVKNNLQNILIKNVLNDYEGNKIDLTSLSIESLSIQDVEKQNVDIIIPPHLKSLIINSCKASIDISKCHLKKIIISNYQGKVMDIYDDKLEVFQNNSNEEVTWYHNNTLLKKNEIYVDTNKITSFKTGYIYYFININNNNNYNNNNNASKTIIFKCNDKEIKINEVYEFSFENKHLYCSLGNIQELDFGEYTFDSFNVTSGKIKYLKVKCNSIILTNVECDNLVTDDVCKRFNLINCTINTLTCGIIKKEEEKLKLVGEEAIKKARNIEKYLLEMNHLFERKLKIDQIRIKKLLKMRDTIVCQISRKFYDNNIKSLTNDIKIRRHQNKHINVILNNLIKELRNPNGKYLISIVNDTNSLQQICSICENIGNYVIDKIAKGTSQHLLTKNVLNYCQSSPNERLCLESFMKIQLIDLSHDLPASGNQLCTSLGFCSKSW
ncbi:hypothetical protein EHI_053860 [Entamoeba histolytica HM-1:IMSS]|uniref:Uncharacterized protein n=1 Tax=Entamoeba histolytica (strain ATCC 30459 / HM-1:IMSS / ABRM) TaxID=294381 RepID=B1N579_ENTH1|nr:hypothetical protein EHI_053860 [Entamoeba histolytica HM-1:IMSS]EDS88880.1 hypothetical protein EHI_053860 [Entamoeba histolytica HM-1:IMSS]|eukprot:XP_001914345.1 hypothetical protein EHI_053860 [Entamoeba histolytica HM-1:IMSS]